jgi:hypothetical protein
MKLEVGKSYRTEAGKRATVDSDAYGWYYGQHGEEGTFAHDLNGVCIGNPKRNLVSEWVDEPTSEAPTIWRDMTAEEKGALLQALKRGRPMDDPKCKTCKFFLDNRQYTSPERCGQCRRYPRNADGLFSIAGLNDWCGEFVERESEHG